MASEDDRHLRISLPVDVVDGLPPHVGQLIEELPFIVGGEQDEELDKLKRGECIVCGRTLGDDTVLILNGEGILAILCGGPCHDDLAILSYLTEQSRDVLQRVDMRHNLTEGND